MHNTAIVNYHIQSNQRQAFHFDKGGIFGNLISPELSPTQVNVEDLRGSEHAMDFATDGITFESHTSQINDFTHPSDWEDIYNHEWFYLSGMTPEEIVIFNTYDNQTSPYIGHSALDMENTSTIQVPRKSIESRTIVRYK